MGDLKLLLKTSGIQVGIKNPAQIEEEIHIQIKENRRGMGKKIFPANFHLFFYQHFPFLNVTSEKDSTTAGHSSCPFAVTIANFHHI